MNWLLKCEVGRTSMWATKEDMKYNIYLSISTDKGCDKVKLRKKIFAFIWLQAVS